MSESLRLVDLRHVGRDRVIGAWVIDDLLIDPGPSSCMPTLLKALGDWRPRAIALTHIHLDHAGVTGSLVRRWPGVEVWVHERGAAHLASPERLMASAERLYGADLGRLFGEVVAVAQSSLRPLQGGERMGGMRVAATPGHASHHVAYLHEHTGRAFVGDVAGVRISPARLLLPPTPPPDIDLELWGTSLDTVGAWAPTALALTHFGLVTDPAGHLGALREALVRWGEMGRVLDEARFVAWVRGELGGQVDAVTADRYLQAAPPEQQWQGLHRYWQRRIS